MCPLYEYFCNDTTPNIGCGYRWSEVQSIEDRMIPMNAPCPKCEKSENICREYSPISQIGKKFDYLSAKNMDPEVKSRLENIKNSNIQNPNTNKLDW